MRQDLSFWKDQIRISKRKSILDAPPNGDKVPFRNTHIPFTRAGSMDRNVVPSFGSNVIYTLHRIRFGLGVFQTAWVRSWFD